MPIGLMLTLIPWILLDFLPMHTQLQMNIAAIIGLVFILTIIKDLKRGYVLACGTVLFFVINFIAVVIFKIDWVVTHMWFLCYAMFAVIAFGSLIIAKPFTMQYARQIAPKKAWNHPIFFFG